MANTTKLKPRRVNSFNEPSEGKNLWYKNDDQFNWQNWWWWYQSFFKTQIEYNELPSSKESDNNLYIIVDSHIPLLSYSQLMNLWTYEAIVNELNKAPLDYGLKYFDEWHIIQGEYEWNDYAFLSSDWQYVEIMYGKMYLFDDVWFAATPEK